MHLRGTSERPLTCVWRPLPPYSGKLLPGLSPLSFLSLLSRASLPFSHKPFSEGKSPPLVSTILASCPSFPKPLINSILQRALRTFHLDPVWSVRLVLLDILCLAHHATPPRGPSLHWVPLSSLKPLSPSASSWLVSFLLLLFPH